MVLVTTFFSSSFSSFFKASVAKEESLLEEKKKLTKIWLLMSVVLLKYSRSKLELVFIAHLPVFLTSRCKSNIKIELIKVSEKYLKRLCEKFPLASMRERERERAGREESFDSSK